MNRFDIHQLQQNYLLDEARAHELVDLFRISVRKDMESMRQAIVSGNLEQVSGIAHKLKASFAYMLKQDISNNFDKLRKMILNQAKFDEIRNQFEIVENDVKTLVESK